MLNPNFNIKNIQLVCRNCRKQIKTGNYCSESCKKEFSKLIEKMGKDIVKEQIEIEERQLVYAHWTQLDQCPICGTKVWEDQDGNIRCNHSIFCQWYEEKSTGKNIKRKIK
jgi:hypothetical protein